MKKLLVLLVATLLSLGFSSCKEEDVLPAATQGGKNTFGCLVNGKVWTPKGYNGTSNLDASYDPYYEGGALDFGAYRYVNNDFEALDFYVNGFSGVGVYKLHNPDSAAAQFRNGKCVYNRSNEVYREGMISITKFDQGIVSGTFEFTLAKAGCDTIRVTQGRFDMKI